MTTPDQRDRLSLMANLLTEDPSLARGRKVMADAMRLTAGQFDYLLAYPDALEVWKKARARWLDNPPPTRCCHLCGITSSIGEFARDASRRDGYSYRHLRCNRLMVRAYRRR